MIIAILLLLIISAGVINTVYYPKAIHKPIYTPAPNPAAIPNATAAAMQVTLPAAIPNVFAMLGEPCLKPEDCIGYGINIGDVTCSSLKKCEKLYPNYIGELVAQSDCIGIDPNYVCV